MCKFYRYDKELKKSKETTLQTAFPFLMKEKCCVSFVGAGGKSSLIACIADWDTLHRKKSSGNYNHPYFPSIFRKAGAKRTGAGTNLAHRQLGGDWYCGSCAATETSKSESTLVTACSRTCRSDSDRSRRLQTAPL